MIKATIFDLGGVYFTNGRAVAAVKIAKKFGLSAEEVEEAMKTKSDMGWKYRRGEIGAKEFWKEFKKKIPLDEPWEELNYLWVDSYEPVAEMVDLVRKLKQKGIKVYYLSDNVRERVEHLQNKHNFMADFVDGIFSHSVKLTKQDGPEVFHMALKKTGEKAETYFLLMIGKITWKQQSPLV